MSNINRNRSKTEKSGTSPSTTKSQLPQTKSLLAFVRENPHTSVNENTTEGTPVKTSKSHTPPLKRVQNQEERAKLRTRSLGEMSFTTFSIKTSATNTTEDKEEVLTESKDQPKSAGLSPIEHLKQLTFNIFSPGTKVLSEKGMEEAWAKWVEPEKKMFDSIQENIRNELAAVDLQTGFDKFCQPALSGDFFQIRRNLISQLHKGTAKEVIQTELLGLFLLKKLNWVKQAIDDAIKTKNKTKQEAINNLLARNMNGLIKSLEDAFCEMEETLEKKLSNISDKNRLLIQFKQYKEDRIKKISCKIKRDDMTNFIQTAYDVLKEISFVDFATFVKEREKAIN